MKRRHIFVNSIVSLFLLTLACLVWDLGWIKRPSETGETITSGLFPCLEPASAHLQVGTIALYFGSNLKQAKTHLLCALNLQPTLVPAWLQLAQLFHQQGEEERAKQILLFLNRTLQDVARWKWQTFSLALVLEDEKVAQESLHRLLEMRPQMADQAFFLAEKYWGPAPELQTHLQTKTLPRYLRYLTSQQRTEEAFLVWQSIDKGKIATWDEVLYFLDYLLAHKRIEEAVQIWRAQGQPWGVTNGSFESPLLERAFGWRTRNVDGVHLTRESMDATEGGFCLTLRFAGTVNVNFSHLYQYVPLGIERRYRLRFLERAEGLTTDQGVFLEVSQAYGTPFRAQSPPLLGTSSWREVTVDFEVPGLCQALVLTVRRKPSHRFDSHIQGAYFLHNVRLEPLVGMHKDSVLPTS
jgi:hypothetical protein